MKKILYPLILILSIPFIAIGITAGFIKECVIFGIELHDQFSDWVDK